MKTLTALCFGTLLVSAAACFEQGSGDGSGASMDPTKPAPGTSASATADGGGAALDGAVAEDASKPSDGFFVPPKVGAITGFEHIAPESYRTVTDVSCDANACVFGSDSGKAWRLSTGAATLEELPGDEEQLASVLLHGGKLFAARCTFAGEDAGAGDVFELAQGAWKGIGGPVRANCDGALGVDRSGNLWLGAELPAGGVMTWKIGSTSTWIAAGDGLPTDARARATIANSKNDLFTVMGKQFTGKVYRRSAGATTWTAAGTNEPEHALSYLTLAPNDDVWAIDSVDDYTPSVPERLAQGASSWMAVPSGIEDQIRGPIVVDATNHAYLLTYKYGNAPHDRRIFDLAAGASAWSPTTPINPAGLPSADNAFDPSCSMGAIDGAGKIILLCADGVYRSN